MDKFLIVKKAIDNADPCGLLACHAPLDEYDDESAEIAAMISDEDSAEEIAVICANVFSRSFAENVSADKFLVVAEEIRRELEKCGGAL